MKQKNRHTINELYLVFGSDFAVVAVVWKLSEWELWIAWKLTGSSRKLADGLMLALSRTAKCDCHAPLPVRDTHTWIESQRISDGWILYCTWTHSGSFVMNWTIRPKGGSLRAAQQHWQCMESQFAQIDSLMDA